LQILVLGFGLLQDGNAGVGVFPEGEEIFVSGECPAVRVQIAYRFVAFQMKVFHIIASGEMGV
jgi:hypothetical protein